MGFVASLARRQRFFGRRAGHRSDQQQSDLASCAERLHESATGTITASRATPPQLCYSPPMSDQGSDQYTDAEAERRSEEVLRRMLNTPPQPHATHRPGHPRNRKQAASDRAVRKPPVHDN